jgi:tryptophan-rich sensory protein
MNKPTKLVISLVLPFLAGFIGSLATMPAIPTWYASLIKPSFSPPNWVFGPVWTTLYLLMGISFYRIWSLEAKPQDTQLKNRSLLLFIIHLFINAFWSIAFFGLQSPLLALIVIVTLLIIILIIKKMFYRLDPLAALLLLPYFLWVSFATLLNFSIWYLN